MPDGYGLPATTDGLLSWDVVEQRLTAAKYYWLATVRPDGTPHSVPRWGVWLDGAFYYDGAPTTRHARNLETNPACTLTLESGETLKVDTLIWAIGRHANTEGLGLEELGVKLDKKGNVIVDEFQETGVPGITALGDVAGKALLTPVAIAAARRLSNRLFGPEKFKDQKLDYDNIPTVVFSYVSFLPATYLT